MKSVILILIGLVLALICIDFGVDTFYAAINLAFVAALKNALFAFVAYLLAKMCFKKA